jgi:phage regulator Rha-like protein
MNATTLDSSTLVFLSDGEPRTTSLAIAEGMELQHKNVIELIRTYLADLAEFGPLAFETRKGQALPHGGFAKGTEYAVLNQEQSTLIMTYMKNTEIARSFKKRLVKAFFTLARQVTGSFLSVSSLQNFRAPVEATIVFDAFHGLALKVGLEGNQAVLSANMATRAATGIDPLQLLGATHLQAGNQNRHYTVTELGTRFNMTGREFNIALEAAGLQTRHGKQWMPTVKGRAYAVLLDTQKRKGTGTPIQQLKWTADIIDVLPSLKGGAQ